MQIETPKIDSRTADDIRRQVVGLLKATSWPKADPSANPFDPEAGASGALIQIFARFAELIIERLNQVPSKNLLAFLDMLGASMLPPRPARAPLTFSLVEGATVNAIVTAGTQVAAMAIAGDKESVVFETERELVVTPARLTALFSRDRQTDKCADHSLLLPQPDENREQGTGNNGIPAQGVSVFEGNQNIDHVLYIANDRIFSHPGRTKLEIAFELSSDASLNVVWEVSDGTAWSELAGAPPAITNGTRLDFSKTLAPQTTAVNGRSMRWLRCRLKDAILPARQPPDIRGMSLTATFEKNAMIEKAFTNSFPLDTSRGFFPFGESPREGDTFYFSIDEAFAEKNCEVTLDVTSTLLSPPDKWVQPLLTWEFWNGDAWADIGEGGAGISDASAVLTSRGKVTLKTPKKPERTTVNGVEACWLRVRLSGKYGPGASLTPVYDTSTPPKIVNYENKAASAPLITSLSVHYKTELSAELPELVLAYNDFAFEEISAESLKNKTAFTPFKPSLLSWEGAWKGAWSANTSYVEGDAVSDSGASWIAKKDSKGVRPVKGEAWASVDVPPEFYLGFELPARVNAFPNSNVSMYIAASGEKDPLDRPMVEWEYSSGDVWSRLVVRDGAEDFTQPGLVEFLAPADFKPRLEFGLNRYWLRAVLKSGTYTPRVSRVLHNTVMASRVTSVTNEVLGLSDGSKNQVFRTALAPVLEGARLEVREPDLPSAAEQEMVHRDNGEDAVSVIRDQSGRPSEIWVRWKDTSDFYGSAPRDRHYTIDHLTGEIRFGDGSSGMIPPMGSIRMASYKSGGGASGNRPAESITELKTTVPYIDKVTNHIAASGGADAETEESLLHRMPRAIRHGNRAVTFEDYEDLAMLASPETARAKCEQVTREIGEPKKPVFEKLRLIVVPNSNSAQPEPSLELKRRVLEFIGARKNPMVAFEVGEPSYIEVTVTVTIAPASLEIANDLKLTVTERLSRFLHPLTGGFEGRGWDFGRQPHLSDLYHLIEAIPGVDHVIALEMIPPEADARFTEGNFLISSGLHAVTCTFTGA